MSNEIAWPTFILLPYVDNIFHKKKLISTVIGSLICIVLLVTKTVNITKRVDTISISTR